MFLYDASLSPFLHISTPPYRIPFLLLIISIYFLSFELFLIFPYISVFSYFYSSYFSYLSLSFPVFTSLRPLSILSYLFIPLSTFPCIFFTHCNSILLSLLLVFPFPCLSFSITS